MDTQVISCGRCDARIRVPRNIGRIKVTCPICKYEFLYNSNFTATYGDAQTADPTGERPEAAAPPRANTPAKKKKGGKAAVFITVMFVIAALLLLGTMVGYYTTEAGDPAAGQQISAYERAGELIPNFYLRYFLNALSDTDLDVICTIYESAMNFEQSCNFDKRVGAERFEQLWGILFFECPELFQLDQQGQYTYHYTEGTQEIISCELPYLIADQDRYETMRSSCEQVIDGWITETSGFSDYEKEKYVFDYIASNCWYDLDAEYAGTPYGALVSHKAKCDGFSGAMKWAMESMGIQCLTVGGDPPAAGEIGHAWNIIDLDGGYYWLDVTASVHEPDGWAVKAGLDEVTYSALNVSDAMFTEYTPMEFFSAIAPIPECNSMAESYYGRMGCLVAAGAGPSEILSRELDRVVSDGGGFAFVQFESAEDFDAYLDGPLSQDLESLLGAYNIRCSYECARFGYNLLVIKLEL